MVYGQVALGNLPVGLVLRQDGVLAFVRVASVFKPVLDKNDAVSAWFFADGFCFVSDEAEEEYEYDRFYDYKNEPLMLAWLKQQNLEA